MKIVLASYGAVSGDGRGYRWMWQGSELSISLLNRCYAKLDCARFSDPQQLRLLQAHTIEGGVLALDAELCAAYRFLHGGRDGSREKFCLVVAVFPRTCLSRLGLAALFSSPAFQTPQEVCPSHTIIECPESSFTPTSSYVVSATNVADHYSGLDSLPRALVACSDLPPHQDFHLRVTGDLQNPTAKLERHVGNPIGHPLSPPGAPTGNPTLVQATPTSKSVLRPIVKTVLVFAVGLLSGLIIGVAIGSCFGSRVARMPVRKSLPVAPAKGDAKSASLSTNSVPHSTVQAVTNAAPNTTSKIGADQ